MRYKEIVGPSRVQELVAQLEELNEGRKTICVSNRETVSIDDPHIAGQQVHAHMANCRAVNQVAASAMAASTFA